MIPSRTEWVIAVVIGVAVAVAFGRVLHAPFDAYLIAVAMALVSYTRGRSHGSQQRVAAGIVYGAAALGADPYTAARTVRNIEVLSSGDPERIANRVKNIAVGRALARAGVFRTLWGGGRR